MANLVTNIGPLKTKIIGFIFCESVLNVLVIDSCHLLQFKNKFVASSQEVFKRRNRCGHILYVLSDWFLLVKWGSCDYTKASIECP